jgi:hypothetical protein
MRGRRLFKVLKKSQDIREARKRNGRAFFSLSAPSSYFWGHFDQAAEFLDLVFMFQGNFPTSGYLVWAGANFSPAKTA